MNLRARWDKWIAGPRAWLRRAPPDAEVHDEVSSFVELLTTEKRSTGLSDQEARRAALQEIGGHETVTQAIRDARPSVLVDRLRQDVRDGWRFVRRAPGLSAAIMLTLALGIGASSALFSVVDGVLLKPLAYPGADRLVAILHNRSNPVSPANFLDWQRGASGFASMGAAEYWMPTLGGIAEPERVFALRVTAEVLPLMGVPPAMGRFPDRGDHALKEVVIADGLWRRAFAADPGVLGRRLLLDGQTYAIAGVMPPGFVFAPFWATRAEIWAPLDLRTRAAERRGQGLRVFARLAPETSLEQARGSIAAVTADLESRFPGTNRGVNVTPLKELVVGDTRPALIVLSIAVLLVLLIGCANVAHLLLVRAAARGREVAVRAALGAPRHRLVRQFLTESITLAVLGGLGGVLLASAAIQLVKQLGAESLPRAQTIAVDERVLAFTVVLSFVTVLIFGVLPALVFARPSGTAALRSAERGSAISRGAGRARKVLVASEVALAILLLAGASLLLRSFITLRGVDAGWAPEGVASLVVSVAGTADDVPERRLALFTQVLEALRALPGIDAAGAINHLPIAGDLWGMPLRIHGRPEPAPGTRPVATYRTVLPGYLETMRLPLVRGRDFTAADRPGSPDVVIVNQRLADVQFPGEDPLGKLIQVPAGVDAPWRTIVGVSKNAVQRTPSEVSGEEVYLPVLQDAGFRQRTGRSNYLTYVIRTADSPATILPSVRAAIRRLAPSAPISDVVVMTDVVHGSTRGAEFTLVIIGVFAALALVLAAIGIYSVISYGVELRRREIGIRLALGATPRGIAGRIVGEGLVVTAIGGGVGLGLAVISAQLMSRLLFGVTPFDVPALAAAAAGLVTAATLACFVPARRASRIDPQAELR